MKSLRSTVLKDPILTLEEKNNVGSLLCTLMTYVHKQNSNLFSPLCLIFLSGINPVFKYFCVFTCRKIILK